MFFCDPGYVCYFLCLLKGKCLDVQMITDKYGRKQGQQTTTAAMRGLPRSLRWPFKLIKEPKDERK